MVTNHRFRMERKTFEDTIEKCNPATKSLYSSSTVVTGQDREREKAY
jgi:hypothetical protein